MKDIRTDTQLRTAKTSKNMEDFKCGAGLYIRVFKSGKKTFRRTQKFGTGTAQVTIGSYPEVSLAQARTYNDYIKEVAKQGHSKEQIKHALKITKSPVEFHAKLSSPTAPSINKIASSKMTFEELSHHWFDNKIQNKKWKPDGKHVKGNWSKLTNHVFPYIGQRPVSEITRVEIIDLLQVDGKWWNSYPQMKKVKGQIAQIFNLARSTRFNLRQDNPADFDPEIEAMNTNHEELARGFMAPEKVPEFVSMLDLTNLRDAAILWLILQAKRPENIVETEWSELDFNRRIWEIPKDKIKTKTHHMSWISDRGLDLLSSLKQAPLESKWVFPADTQFGHIDYNALNRSIMRILGDRREEFTDQRSAKPVTAHGFRHTFKTWAKEQGFQDELSEAQEARSKRGISATYDHSYQVEARIPMMTAWDDFVAAKI
jgi:integrase